MYNYIVKDNAAIVHKINRPANRIMEVEAWLWLNFYEHYIDKLDRTKLLETSQKFMRDYLVIVGVAEVSLDWSKYEDNSAYNVDGWHSNQIDFSRWLDLYRNFKVDWV